MINDEFDQVIAKHRKSLRIAWWNTHLTPPKGKALPAAEHGLVLEVIILLLTGSDVLFLGEVSSSDLDWFSKELDGTPYVVKDMTRGANSRKFNLGVIFNEEVFSFIGSEFCVARIGGDNYKIACRMDFVFHGEDYFSFLVSHWPSRLLKRDDAEIRGHYGGALRKEVESLQAAGLRYLVVLGDFNDEPFNHSMTTYLRGCRDAAFVVRNPELLYNPFWKEISCPKGYVRPPAENAPTGTYFYANDNLHRWRVFDQMLFCSAFVGNSTWHLEDEKTGVFRYARLVTAVESSVYKLDHLPIVAELSKEHVDG
jgi:hypothetical protein